MRLSEIIFIALKLNFMQVVCLLAWMHVFMFLMVCFSMLVFMLECFCAQKCLAVQLCMAVVVVWLCVCSVCTGEVFCAGVDVPTSVGATILHRGVYSVVWACAVTAQRYVLCKSM